MLRRLDEDWIGPRASIMLTQTGIGKSVHSLADLDRG